MNLPCGTKKPHWLNSQGGMNFPPLPGQKARAVWYGKLVHNLTPTGTPGSAYYLRRHLRRWSP